MTVLVARKNLKLLNPRNGQGELRIDHSNLSVSMIYLSNGILDEIRSFA